MSSTTTSWDALEKRLNNIKKPVSVFRLCDDTEIRDRYLKAKRDVEQIEAHLASLGKDATPETLAAVQEQAEKAKAELAAAQKAYDQHTVTLRFRALERQELEELLAKYPPSEKEEEDGAEFADAFMPALISAASLDGMPEEAAARFMRTWTPADARALWQAAWSVQHTQRTDLGKG